MLLRIPVQYCTQVASRLRLLLPLVLRNPNNRLSRSFRLAPKQKQVRQLYSAASRLPLSNTVLDFRFLPFPFPPAKLSCLVAPRRWEQGSEGDSGEQRAAGRLGSLGRSGLTPRTSEWTTRTSELTTQTFELTTGTFELKAGTSEGKALAPDRTRDRTHHRETIIPEDSLPQCALWNLEGVFLSKTDPSRTCNRRARGLAP